MLKQMKIIGVMFYVVVLTVILCGQSSKLQASDETDLENLIIPYSISNLSFHIENTELKEADHTINKVIGVQCKIELQPNEYDDFNVVFSKDLNGNVEATCEVLKGKVMDDMIAYEVDQEMSQNCKIQALENELMVDYSGNWVDTDLYQVMVYIQTEGAFLNNVEQGENAYNEQLLGRKLHFNVKDISVRVEYKKPIINPMSGLVGYEYIEGEIPLKNMKIEATYEKMPKIY